MKVLITGGSRGIGKAVGEIFAKNGYEIFSPTRSELNLNSAESVENFLKKYEDISFDSVINNAGINETNIIENISDEEFLKTLTVNLISPVRLLRGLVPGIKQSNAGRIVNIGSIWAVVSKEGRSSYSASKNALYGITNTLALELSPFGVLVNMVCPGYTQTELTRQNNSPEQILEISRKIPLKRMAEPSEIAEFIYYIGSAKNTYITGQKLVIDGGYCIQ